MENKTALKSVEQKQKLFETVARNFSAFLEHFQFTF